MTDLAINRTLSSYTSDDKISITAEYNNMNTAIIDTISYQIQREMAPIYTMGTNPPKPTRKIAGSILFKSINFKNCDYINIAFRVKNEDESYREMHFKDITFYNTKPFAPISFKNLQENTLYNFIALKMIPWVTIKEPFKEDDLQGMVYNPITDTWNWGF